MIDAAFLVSPFPGFHWLSFVFFVFFVF